MGHIAVMRKRTLVIPDYVPEELEAEKTRFRVAHTAAVEETQALLESTKASNGAGQAAQQMQMQQKLMQMQQEMAKAQQEVEEATFTASVGGGAVSAAANGKKEITALTIKPEAVDPEDVEMLQDLVISAVNEALRQADDAMSSRMNSFTSGLNIPGLGL